MSWFPSANADAVRMLGFYLLRRAAWGTPAVAGIQLIPDGIDRTHTASADGTHPIPDRPAPIADRTHPIADRTYPIADGTHPIADGTHPILDRTHPIAVRIHVRGDSPLRRGSQSHRRVARMTARRSTIDDESAAYF